MTLKLDWDKDTLKIYLHTANEVARSSRLKVIPAGCGHSKLDRARTGLPQTSVQFISVTEVVTKSVTKKRNEIFFAKASGAEIWTRVRRRH